jgi:myo-inositol 2-dehydrogenase/D-chiro-inositol 1-dehydrogenase
VSGDAGPGDVRLGVVGAGAHSTGALLPSLRAMEACIVAICDRDGELASQRARAFGIPASYSDHQAMLAAEALDGVIVIGPPAMHEAVGLDVIAAGLPLFVEKPPAATLAGALRLEQAAARSGTPVMVGFMKRYAKVYRRALQISRSAEFGTPRLLRLNISHWRVAELREHMLLNGVHAFDLARHFMGEVVAGTVALRPVAGSHVAALLLEHAGGGFSQVTVSASEPRYQESAEIEGDCALIRTRGLSELRYLRSAPDKRQAAEPDDETSAGIWEPQSSLPYLEHQSLYIQGYIPELRAFADAIASGRAPVPGITEGVRAMELAEAVMAAPAGLSALQLPNHTDDRILR